MTKISISEALALGSRLSGLVPQLRFLHNGDNIEKKVRIYFHFSVALEEWYMQLN